ncbi:MAG: hypothetical protein [Microviridae sp.]|nr:MAG: hypothetical protein [Microviridae sp.]
MAILYKSTKWDLVCEDEHQTEQEHIESCDANKILKAALRGQMILGNGRQPIYGNDDLTMDGLSFRIEKARLEQELGELSTNMELTQEEIDSIHPKVREKFQFRTKKREQKAETKTNEPNEQKQTAKPPEKTPEPTPN